MSNGKYHTFVEAFSRIRATIGIGIQYLGSLRLCGGCSHRWGKFGYEGAHLCVLEVKSPETGPETKTDIGCKKFFQRKNRKQNRFCHVCFLWQIGWKDQFLEGAVYTGVVTRGWVSCISLLFSLAPDPDICRCDSICTHLGVAQLCTKVDVHLYGTRTGSEVGQLLLPRCTHVVLRRWVSCIYHLTAATATTDIVFDDTVWAHLCNYVWYTHTTFGYDGFWVVELGTWLYTKMSVMYQ